MNIPPPLPPEWPAVTAEQEGAILARERVRLLAWGYYLLGGLAIGTACILFFEAVMFGCFSFMPSSTWKPSNPSAPAAPPPLAMFQVMAGVMGVIATGIGVVAILDIVAGWCLQKRKARIFVCVMAGFSCLWIPFGTALGIATFLVLTSEAGKREFL